ncbi:aminotransferase class I/II-fold pyridoxal phosphate-dependent enzyme [Armatimonas sp.]|uniref:pyridoxal phosphate-dependent decarboxylase family protein n=1 Tax=Armatimonas sp. TaxID=1872638 RepID=UPI00286CB97B|nr:aminotransferase class I/II-fold pyridoxal phosphate-dependent enzyme [Armatimonas sp.]
MHQDSTLDILKDALATLGAGFTDLPPHTETADPAAISAVLREVAVRLQDNYPYFHPLYAGQMLKPPHPVARLAYQLALYMNPNNHALDGGRASSQMEKEAVAQLAAMFGWTTFLGHLTSGGTMANLEALWVAGRLAPGKVVLASSQAHYTHGRISAVLGLPFEAVPVDRFGRMDTATLEARLERGDVGCVVATLGTTATGSVDPLPEILALRQKYGFRLHADAAYGGYFGLAENLGESARAAFDQISGVDSLVIDPHKHGLQPYGCGCVLFRDPSVGHLYKHDSPYTYFSSTELHLGEISLECSRAGAAAVALWATQRLLPLTPTGEFAGMLAQCRSAALALYEKLAADPRFMVGLPPELDIVVWTVREGSARAVFEEAARRGLHLALAELPGAFFGLDTERVSCLRSVQMKPEHADSAWQEALWSLLSNATDAITSRET